MLSRPIDSLQDVRRRRRASTAQALRHPRLHLWNLILAGTALKLQAQFCDLIHAGCTAGIAACLRTTEGANGNTAFRPNASILRQFPSFAALREAASFERERGKDREAVVQLENLNVFGLDAGEGVSLVGGVDRCAE